jgi:hypothetical protein
MSDFQAEKSIVRNFFSDLGRAGPDEVAGVLERHTHADWLWRGMHPFHEQRGAEAVARTFWAPLLSALSRVQRRPDILMAGRNEMDGFQSTWVVQMGHLMGLFDRPWLGIRPTGKMAFLRFVEFHKVVDGRISETAHFVDIPHLMIQAGQDPFPPQTGAHLVQPGPMTHEGLMWDAQDPALGTATLAAINAMLGGMKSRRETDSAREEGAYEAHLRETWHDDMIWWGPAGIGAAYTTQRYTRQHAGPFNDCLSDGYRFNGHLCRLAEGHFGGFFGWANLTLRNSGGYLGMTASPGFADMRVVDLYREQDGKLAENWIFIDILHYLNMQGLDVLGRMASLDPALQAEPFALRPR